MLDVIDKTCSVHSFEPVYWPILVKNIEQFGTDVVRVYPFGLGNENVVIQTTIHAWNNSEVGVNFGATSLEDGLCEDSKVALYRGTYPVRLPIITMDFARFDSGQMCRRVSVVKIDVEGMETKVLEGMERMILEERPSILIEIWESRKESFFESPVGRKITDVYDVYQPNSEMFPQCGMSKEDYVFIPKGKRASFENNPKFVLQTMS